MKLFGIALVSEKKFRSMLDELMALLEKQKESARECNQLKIDNCKLKELLSSSTLSHSQMIRDMTAKHIEHSQSISGQWSADLKVLIAEQYRLKDLLIKAEEKSERTIPVQMPVPMAKEEIAAALAQVRDETPLWRVLMYFIAVDIVTATEGVSSPKNREEREHISGGLAWALDFRDKLVSERAKAQRLAGQVES